MAGVFDTIILGGGPGGYTAALYCARAGLSTLVIEKGAAGGQIALTPRIDNYPGFPEGVDGAALGAQMRQGAERFGAKTVQAEALSLSLRSSPKRVETDGGCFLSQTVILATGAEPRLLGVPGEARLTGKGVSYCAACDGMFYQGKTVAVVGGGNTAASDALLLSRICKKVFILPRRERLRAEKFYVNALEKAENVEFRLGSVVTELLGQERLTGLRVRTGDRESVLPCDGVFLCVGRQPVTALVRGQLSLDENGYIPADASTRTEIPGVFAVGDVRTKAVRQIVTAAADGAAACHYAAAYLAE